MRDFEFGWNDRLFPHCPRSYKIVSHNTELLRKVGNGTTRRRSVQVDQRPHRRYEPVVRGVDGY